MLADYLRPSVAVDTAVLTLAPETTRPLALPHTGCRCYWSDDPRVSVARSGRYRGPSCTRVNACRTRSPAR